MDELREDRIDLASPWPLFTAKFAKRISSTNTSYPHQPWGVPFAGLPYVHLRGALRQRLSMCRPISRIAHYVIRPLPGQSRLFLHLSKDEAIPSTTHHLSLPRHFLSLLDMPSAHLRMQRCCNWWTCSIPGLASTFTTTKKAGQARQACQGRMSSRNHVTSFLLGASQDSPVSGGEGPFTGSTMITSPTRRPSRQV